MMWKLNPNERLLVESGVNHYKLVGPRLVLLAPWQKVLATLYVGPQEYSFRRYEVRTGEDIPLNFDLRIVYRVEEEYLTPELLPQIPWLHDGMWQNILDWRIEEILRKLVGSFHWRDLNKESSQRQLERRLLRTAAGYLKVIGLCIMSVSLVKIELPAGLQQTILQAEQDSIEPMGRAQALREYAEMFEGDLVKAMPYIIQWELLRVLRENGQSNVILTNGALSLGEVPREATVSQPLFQMQLPLPQSKDQELGW